ncbi:hypothetical protein IH86_16920 [Sphingobium yanoikuyae]|nr:hypothetical protein IH86_16920 [Sphingobium yanoikuyae]
MVEQAAPLFEDGSAPMFMSMATAVAEVAVGKLFYAIAPLGDPNVGKKRLFLRIEVAPYYQDQGDAAAPGTQAQINASAAQNQAAVAAVEARQDDVETTLSGALSSSSYRPTPADGADLPIGTYFLAPNASDDDAIWSYQRIASAPGYEAVAKQAVKADNVTDTTTKVMMTTEERAFGDNGKTLRATGYEGATGTALAIQTAVPLSAYPPFATLDIVAPTNSTGAVIVSIDGLPNRGLTREDGVSIGAGDLVAGRRYTLAVTPDAIWVRGSLGKLLSQAVPLRTTSYTGSTENALVIATGAPGLTAMPTTWSMYIQPTITNTGAMTIAIDGLGAINLTRDEAGGALTAGEIVAGNRYLVIGSSTTARVSGAGLAKRFADHKATTDAAVASNAASASAIGAKLLGDPTLVFEYPLTTLQAGTYGMAGILTYDQIGDAPVNAMGGNLSVGATADSIQLRLWRRTNLAAEGGPGTDPGDTLLETVTKTPAQLGVTPGGAAVDVRVAFPTSYTLAPAQGFIEDAHAFAGSTRVIANLGKTTALNGASDALRGWYRTSAGTTNWAVLGVTTSGTHIWLGHAELTEVNERLGDLDSAVADIRIVPFAEAMRGPARITRERFVGAAVPAGWTLGAGVTINNGLIGAADTTVAGGSYNGRSSIARDRVTRAIFSVVATDTFGIAFKPQDASGLNGQALRVDGPNSRLEIYYWDGASATGNGIYYRAALSEALTTGQYMLEHVQHRRTSTGRLIRLDTGAVIATVTYAYGGLSPYDNAVHNAGRAHGQAGVFGTADCIDFQSLVPRPQSPDVIILGDSNTEGVVLAADFDKAWPYLLEDANPDARIMIAARGGHTTALLLANLAADLDPYSPRQVVLAIGTNDCNNLANGASLATAQANLTALINRVVARGARPVLVCIPPITGKATNVGAWNDAIRSYAYGPHPYIDFARALSSGDLTTWNAPYDNGDGLHANVAAQAVMAAAAPAVIELG